MTIINLSSIIGDEFDYNHQGGIIRARVGIIKPQYSARIESAIILDWFSM